MVGESSEFLTVPFLALSLHGEGEEGAAPAPLSPAGGGSQSGRGGSQSCREEFPELPMSLLQGWGLLGPRNELFDAAKYRLLADQLGCPDERWCSEGKWRSKSGPSLADLSTCWRRMEPDDAIQPMEQGRMPKAMRREELEEGELEEGELEEGELEEEAIDVSDYLPMAHQDARTPGRDARWVWLGMLGQGRGKGGFYCS